MPSLRTSTAASSTGRPRTKQHLVGLAISGGGIRSATFGLGVLETLKELDRLKQVHYLSTVSGGWLHRCLAERQLQAQPRLAQARHGLARFHQVPAPPFQLPVAKSGILQRGHVVDGHDLDPQHALDPVSW